MENLTGNTKLVKILNEILGLRKSISIRITELISFFIAQSLIQNRSVYIQGVGELLLKKNRKGANTYHFRPTTAFKREVSRSNCNYLTVLKTSYKDLGIENTPELNSNLRHSEGDSLKFKRKGIIQESLLYYLQKDFPYDYPWKHPSTKKTYGSNRFKAAIKIARDNYPEGYECLFVVWVSLGKKDGYLEKLGVTESEFVTRAEKALDLILQIVVNEDLEPSRMNRLFNVSYYI